MTEPVTWDQVRAFRLARHGLTQRQPADRLLQVVRAICGVQAQVQSAADLQLWARLDGLQPADVRAALWDERTLVRTWAMRGTLHVLAAADLPAYVAALSTHDRWWKGAWLKMIDCSADELRAVLEAIRQTLTDTPLRREELAAEIARRVGPRLRERMLSGWAEMLKPAAFAGDLIGGPPDGQNATFVNPARWLGDFEVPDAATGWRHVVEHYLAAYGPASREEFARWWGMQPAPAGRALKSSGADLIEVSIEGQLGFLRRADLLELQRAPTQLPLRLLPAFDVYTIGTRPRSALVDREHEDRVFRQAGWISPIVLIDGIAAGVWTHSLEQTGVRIQVELLRAHTRAEQQAVAAEADRLGAYFGLPATVTYTGAPISQ